MTEAEAKTSIDRDFKLRGPAANYYLFDGFEALLEGGTRTSKGHPLWEVVWTPTGPKPVGELQVGDEVLGGDGAPTKVVQIHELGERDIYRVRFNTKEEVFTTDDHLWELTYRKNHSSMEESTDLFTTKEIGERVNRGRWDAWVPMSVAHFKDECRDLPMHPYVLGVLLGDGALTGRSVSFSKDAKDREVVDRVDALWPGGVNTYKDGRQHGLLGALPVLRALGLHGKKSTQKFIPRMYQYSSISARMELLRGLMDTDGGVNKKTGMPTFAVSCQRLAEDFLTVVQSLGGAGNITVHATACADSYHVNFRFSNAPELFTLRRKKALARSREKFKVKRLIRSVESLGAPEPARCITVEALDGLYMTMGFIVTHNSWAFMIKAKDTADRYPNSRQLIVRQTRKSLNESILRDWRAEILYRGHPAISPTASKEHQDIYVWPNGSEVFFAGLEGMNDTASPILSTKWDRIYICQAEECSQNDCETLVTRLSSYETPYRQITYDCNPAAPSHWLNVRFAPEKLNEARARFPFRHYDNPLFYNGLYPKGNWTKEGAEYIKILESTLTGVRRERFLKGKWVAVEGQILESWDPRHHLIDAELEVDPTHGALIHAPTVSDQPIRVAYFTAGVDWGWDPDPGCMSLWAYDSPRWHPHVRRFRVAEVMKLRWQLDQWADLAEHWWREYGVKWYSCDPHRPENINALNIRLSKLNYRGAPKIAVKCPPIGGGHQRDSRKYAAIDLMREGLMSATGHIRTRLFKDAFPEGVDEELRRKGKPTCYEQEIESWVYKMDQNGNPTSRPEDGDDHCFVGETRVLTPSGEKRIDEIKAGDFVETHLGPRRVEWAGETGERETIVRELPNGRILRGTPEHEVWTARGWKRLDALRYDDIIVIWERLEAARQRWSFDTGSDGPGILTLPASQLDRTFVDESQGGSPRSISTALYGRESVGTFHVGCTFTTLTAIQATTQLGILSWSPLGLTPNDTLSLATGFDASESTWRGFALLLEIGTDQAKDENGTERTARSASPSERSSSSTAISAERNSRASTRSRSDVPGRVVSEPFGQLIPTITTVGDLPGPGLRSVRKVYDLRVEEAHTFFADGLLVANCLDTARYDEVLNFVRGFGGKLDESKFYEPGSDDAMLHEDLKTMARRKRGDRKRRGSWE